MVHSSQLAAGSFSDASLHTIYTAPASTRVIVKGVAVRSAAGTAGAVQLVLATGSVAVSLGLWCAAAGSNGDTNISQPWLVMNAGDQLKIEFPSASGGWFWIAGAVLPT